MTESSKYNAGTYTVFLSAFLVLFQIGLYFVYIPWNAERLQICLLYTSDAADE